MQVGLTDNTPINVMGGTIVPLGQGGMVTDSARNSSLTLVVAFPPMNGSSAPVGAPGSFHRVATSS